MGPCRRPCSYPHRRSVSSSFHHVSIVVSSVIQSRRFPSCPVSSSHPPHFRIVRRFRLLVATCPCFPRPVPSFRRRPVPRPVRRLVSRFVVVPPLVSFIVSSSRSSFRLVVSFLIRRLVPAPRSSTRQGGAFPIRWRAGRASKHESVAGRGIARGVASMRWAGAGKQADRRGRRSDMKSPRLIYETGRGVGAYRFSHERGGEGILFPRPLVVLAIVPRST